MKKRFIAAIIAVLIITGVAAYQYLKTSRNDGMLVLSGTVEVTEVNVGFKTAGRIADLRAEEGQRVTSGDRLAVLDNAELRSIVEQNRAAVRNAEAEFEKARKDHDRYRNLSQDGAISTQQLDAAQKAYDVSRSQFDQARAALRTAEVRLHDMTLDAPVSGIVLVRNVEPGETIAAGVAVYALGDLANPWVQVYVSETKLGMVKLGQKAEVSVDTFPGKSYEGRVTYIASEAEFTPKNVQTQEERVKLVFGVKVSVTNQNDELKPGMPADVKINIR
ncbi:MAG: efflux RND transporter periplasmic adaptor subunit [Nitrospirota bacterium]